MKRAQKWRTVAINALKLRRDPKLKKKSRDAILLLALSRSINYPTRFARHFALVVKHKTYVFLYCAYAGQPFRGLAHDWSKFSPAEFFESVRYFNGRRSPVGLAREIEGYSFAWLHHKGRNKHHYEFWQDVVDLNGVPISRPNEIVPLPMPYEYALEMICDTIAASRAYNGKKFSYDVLALWWAYRRLAPTNMHPQTFRFCDAMYAALKSAGNCSPLKNAKEIYERTQNGN